MRSLPLKEKKSGQFKTTKNHYRPEMPFRNRKKNILENLSSSELSQPKKYLPPGNVKFNYLDIFQSLNCVFQWEKSFEFLLS